MFLRRYTRTVAGKKLTYYALVESIRSSDGPRQRVVAHLGELNDAQQLRWQRTLIVYNRHGESQQLRLFPEDADPALDADPDVVRVRLSQVGWTNARNFGDLYLALWLWRYLKLDEILQRQLPLGRVLIQNNVLRRIEPTAFLRVTPGPAMIQWFGLDQATPTYGRLAMIHCDNQPAVELVEIVAPE